MKSDIKYVILIILIFISGVIETDIYLPAFTDMMSFFKQSEQNIQKLLTWNFIALCISGPIYGPISDSYGRKKPLLFALLLFLIGSFITSVVHNYEWLLFGRVLQGLGSGGCFTIGTAIIFDIFSYKKAIEILNKINIIVPFIMASAPLLGGYLNSNFGFRSNFYAITFCVLICIISCISFLHETLDIKARNQFNFLSISKNFTKVLINLNFIQLTIVVSLIFSGFITFISLSAIIFINEFKVHKTIFPYYQFSLLIAYLLASITCTRLIDTFGVNKIKKMGMFSVFISNLTLITVSIIAPKNPILLTLSMIPYCFGYIWIQTPYVAEVMGIIPDIKGITASILTSFRLLITAGSVAITSYYYNSTIIPVTASITFVSCLVLIISYTYEKNKNTKLEN